MHLLWREGALSQHSLSRTRTRIRSLTLTPSHPNPTPDQEGAPVSGFSQQNMFAAARAALAAGQSAAEAVRYLVITPT